MPTNPRMIIRVVNGMIQRADFDGVLPKDFEIYWTCDGMPSPSKVALRMAEDYEIDEELRDKVPERVFNFVERKGFVTWDEVDREFSHEISKHELEALLHGSRFERTERKTGRAQTTVFYSVKN